MSDILPLSPIQVRILGCLIEKKATTPDQYPLTLNALRNACNQKSNRHPVTNYELGAIGHELHELERLQLVRMERSARAERYEHRLTLALELKARDIAVLCPLMLRGPQTAAEVKTRSYEVLGMDDLDSFKEVLQRLQEHEPPLVTILPRQPGQKEDRYMHLLCGEPDLAEYAHAPITTSRAPHPLEERVEQLEAEVAAMRRLLENLVNRE
ncbi:MAG: YceH family protein [Wenzhouxiangellaceae bacterium]